ncbi:hypothetical protein BT93_H3135 [Corymbia citriodora subsp. variegata]|nr:hypothetical protein BT93_H3135 [Corymbia citriodora subsp. variegata]
MSLQDQKLRSVRSHSMETATESGYHLISAEELPTGNFPSASSLSTLLCSDACPQQILLLQMAGIPVAGSGLFHANAGNKYLWSISYRCFCYVLVVCV